MSHKKQIESVILVVTCTNAEIYIQTQMRASFT